MTPVDAAVRFFHDVDRRDWTALRAALTDTVDVDYTSLSGGTPESLRADELLGRWQALLPGFDATQHFLGPLAPAADDPADDSDDDVRRLECNVRGYHRIDEGDRVWMVAGWYGLTLRRAGSGWQVAGIALHVAYQEGDTSLPELATKRALG